MEGGTVTLDGSGSRDPDGTIAKYEWSFGDGASGTGASPSHSYSVKGTYTVTLTVNGPGGSATKSVPDAVVTHLAASATVRNGSGQNRTLYRSTSLPVLGGVWTAEVDTAQHPGAGIVLVFGSNAPFSGLFLPAGELLVRFPAQGGARLFRLAAGSRGVRASFAVPVPADPILIGLTACTQAKILGGVPEFCNALDLVLGF